MPVEGKLMSKSFTASGFDEASVIGPSSNLRARARVPRRDGDHHKPDQHMQALSWYIDQHAAVEDYHEFT